MNHEPTKVLVGSWFIVDGENYEEWTTPKITSYWKATNAHRGHTETSVEGYTEILSGWTTGMPDETVRRKALFNDWVQKTLQHTPCGLGLRNHEQRLFYRYRNLGSYRASR